MFISCRCLLNFYVFDAMLYWANKFIVAFFFWKSFWHSHIAFSTSYRVSNSNNFSYLRFFFGVFYSYIVFNFNPKGVFEIDMRNAEKTLDIFGQHIQVTIECKYRKKNCKSYCKIDCQTTDSWHRKFKCKLSQIYSDTTIRHSVFYFFIIDVLVFDRHTKRNKIKKNCLTNF